jgi:signal transduction histidine kinase
VCNHELLTDSPTLLEVEPLPITSRATNTPVNGRRIDDDQSLTRLGGPEMRLARLPTAPATDPQSTRRTQHALRREACATAVTHDRDRIAEGLYDTVIHRLFAAGLQLQATALVADTPTQARIETTIDLLDSTIIELREAIFSLH